MRFRTIALSVASTLAISFLAACGGGSSSSGTGTGGGGTITPAAAKYIYTNADVLIGGYYSGAIMMVPVATSGTATPTLVAQPGSLNNIRSMRTDGNGNLYVLALANAGYSNVSVYVYAILGNGTLGQLRQFTWNAPSSAEGMAVDKSGNVFVNLQNGSINKFISSASGQTAPSATLSVTHLFYSMACDSSGNVYAYDGQTVEEFAAGFTSTTPIRTLSVNETSPTGDPDITVDSSGNIVTATPTLHNGGPAVELFVFAPGATSATTSIPGPVFGEGTMVNFDAQGNIWTNGISGLNAHTFYEYTTSGTLLGSFTITDSRLSQPGYSWSSVAVY